MEKTWTDSNAATDNNRRTFDLSTKYIEYKYFYIAQAKPCLIITRLRMSGQVKKNM
jgi:hypothetical protein